MADAPLEQDRAFGGVVDILEAMEVEYLIWGGVAVVMYGEPRFTQDMDIVIRLSRNQVGTLARLFEKDGYDVSAEAIRDALERHFYFNVIHLETNIKVDFCIAGRDPVLNWAFEHRQMKQFDEFRRASYMPPESVILTKLQAFRKSGSTRHLDDIESNLCISRANWTFLTLTARLLCFWRCRPKCDTIDAILNTWVKV
jgi:hypothetical protein